MRHVTKRSITTGRQTELTDFISRSEEVLGIVVPIPTTPFAGNVFVCAFVVLKRNIANSTLITEVSSAFIAFVFEFKTTRAQNAFVIISLYSVVLSTLYTQRRVLHFL